MAPLALAQETLRGADALAPYTGPTADGIDMTSLHGKVMCGYQGWFMAEGDGYPAGFVHWGGVGQEPPTCTVDLWPDLGEFDPDEVYETNYRHADGTPAKVFSSVNEKTVLRHFEWMREYGIDGAFVQRFTACIDPARPESWNDRRTNEVLAHCRQGANRSGRGFAVMYDCDFDRADCDKIMADWTRLREQMRILETPAYMTHRGGPIVSLWGFGFDHRRFEAGPAEELLAFLKRPENGACTIMLGVPNDWVDWTDDRKRLIETYATIISPWNVGRYRDPDGARRWFDEHWPKDLAYCNARDKDYYAVVFPGFSWTNLTRGRGPLDEIPRRGGRFFWSQIEQVRAYGMDMAYIAMFDEVDEGTAIFKVTNDPPVGAFVNTEGLASDFYLRLAGLAGRYLQGEPVEFPGQAETNDSP